MVFRTRVGLARFEGDDGAVAGHDRHEVIAPLAPSLLVTQEGTISLGDRDSLSALVAWRCYRCSD
jgi:hypothetical protein